MANQILALPWIRPGRVTVIPNAIQCEKFFMSELREKARQELGLDKQQIAIGFTGRIEQVKRLDLLLVAFAEVYKCQPHARLLLAGEGNLRPDLEQLSAQLGVSQVVNWIGFCRDIPRFLSALDIYVQPSINEGLSLSILEAMAAKKPVIATRVGGIEEVNHGQQGWNLGSTIFISGEYFTLLNLVNQPEKRDMLANTAFELVQREYRINQIGRTIWLFVS